MNRRDAIKALMVGLPAAATVSVAQLQPSDVIVIQVPGHLDPEGLFRMRATAQAVWPGQRVVVLEGGATLQVVKEAAK